MKNIYTLIFLAFISQALNATIINVPGDYASIQEAILQSGDGDTVLVEPGVYYENINFRGHNIVLTSRFYENLDTTYISSTIIDGSAPVDPDTASCIILNSQENETCVIQGFTIRGGGGTVWFDIHGAGTYREGGAILTEFSSPVIQHNILRDNDVVDETGINGSGGGAIRSGDSYPLIQNNLIVYNHAIGYGGAIVLNYGGAVIRNNVIAYNTSGEEYGGGGIWCTGADPNTIVTVENNTIAYNTAEGSGGFAGKGGAIFVFSVHVDIVNNIIWGNDQTTGGPIWSSGGDLIVSYSDVEGGYSGTGNIDSDPLFDNCFILSSNSPCIDAGNPDAIYNDPGSGTAANYPSKGTVTNDIGAYGGPASSDLTCQQVISSVQNWISNDKLSFNCFPNPFSQSISISFELPASSHVLIELQDLRGRSLTSVINENLPAGQQVISFYKENLSHSITSGTYLLHLKTADYNMQHKIVLINDR